MDKLKSLPKDFVNRKLPLATDIERRRTPLEDKIAYVGVCFVQLSLIPSYIAETMPHFSLPLMVFIGLICYQYRAWKQTDMVYTVGNTIGLILNASVLIRIWVS